jgi:hypothetical protein
MQQLRPWQIVLFVAAVLALGFIGYKVIRGNGINVEHDLLVVDVITGELYEIDTNGRGIVLPTKNPATGERTMFAIFKDEDGQWFLEGRALGAVLDRELDTGEFVNRETGAIEIDLSEIHKVNAKDLVKR